MKATNVKVWSDNMKHSAFNAWKMLVMSLPKGIVSFIMAAAGLSISLPLSVLIIGLPLLSLTLVLCRRMMDTEKEYAESWIRGVQQASPISGNMKSPENRGGWKSILSVLGQARSYRGILYCMLSASNRHCCIHNSDCAASNGFCTHAVTAGLRSKPANVFVRAVLGSLGHGSAAAKHGVIPAVLGGWGNRCVVRSAFASDFTGYG